jgi:hypothetical protein
MELALEAAIAGRWAVGGGQWVVGSGQWVVGSGQWVVQGVVVGEGKDIV